MGEERDEKRIRRAKRRAIGKGIRISGDQACP
jgi:hypothetical protein